MKLASLEPDFAAIMQKILDRVKQCTGLDWAPVSCRRTIAEQNALYAQGRTARGQKVTNAKGGQSPHNFGLACDCAPIKNGAVWWTAPQAVWDVYGSCCREQGMAWGGDFKSIQDNPHCEAPSWKEVQAAWKEGKLHVA